MRYLIYLLLFPVFSFAQIGGGINSSFSNPNFDFEPVCYSDGTDTLEGYIQKVYGKGDAKIYDINYDIVVGATPLDSKYCNYSISTVCKKACVNGIEVDVIIGYNIDGSVAWYSDEKGAKVNPDFDSDCPAKTCENVSLGACADGDYTGINDGDQLIAVIQECSDGTKTIISLSLLSDPTVLIAIPANLLFQDCDDNIQTQLIRECRLGVINIVLYSVDTDDLAAGLTELSATITAEPCEQNLLYIQDCWVNDADATDTRKIISVYEANTFPLINVGYLEEDKTTVTTVTGWTLDNSCNCK